MSSNAWQNGVGTTFGVSSILVTRAPWVTCGSMLSPAGVMIYWVPSLMRRIWWQPAVKSKDILEMPQLRQPLKGKEKRKQLTCTGSTVNPRQGTNTLHSWFDWQLTPSPEQRSSAGFLNPCFHLILSQIGDFNVWWKQEDQGITYRIRQPFRMMSGSYSLRHESALLSCCR